MTEKPPVLHDDRYALINHEHEGGGTATLPTTTKGDLIVHNGATNVREGVGTDTHVLTADSTTSTGIKWAAAPGAGGGDNIQVNAVAVTDANFNDTTPAAPSNAVNARFQRSGSGPDAVSANVPVTPSGNIVGTGRSIATASPLTGGGDLSADRTLDFDETVAIGNNARVMVRKNAGADVGPRRRLNFIEESGITITLTDDAGDEEVEIRIGSSNPPGGTYGPGSYTILTGAFRLAAKRQEFKGTDRVTIQGTGRLSLHN